MCPMKAQEYVFIQQFKDATLSHVDLRPLQEKELEEAQSIIDKAHIEIFRKTLETAGKSHELLDALVKQYQQQEKLINEIVFLQGVYHIFNIMAHLLDDATDLLQHRKQNRQHSGFAEENDIQPQEEISMGITRLVSDGDLEKVLQGVIALPQRFDQVDKNEVAIRGDEVMKEETIRMKLTNDMVESIINGDADRSELAHVTVWEMEQWYENECLD